MGDVTPGARPSSDDSNEGDTVAPIERSSDDHLSEDHEEIKPVPDEIRKAWEPRPIGYTREQAIADKRARTPVHCAACGGEFPGTTELHNGICDECRKLTHGPNYRLIAELKRQEELREMDARRHEIAWKAMRGERDAAQADAERLRSALEDASFALDDAGYQVAASDAHQAAIKGQRRG